MFPIQFSRRAGSPIAVLCLGAHSDDIEIGCGGTILRLSQDLGPTRFHWVVFSGNSDRAAEATRSAQRFLRHVSHKTISVQNYRDGFLPYTGAEIKEYFEKLKQEISPDVIFTHYRHDLHQDHRLISELTWNTFRNHLILEYEVIKYDGDLGAPNFFVQLDRQTCHRKVKYILSAFKTQDHRSWFTDDTLLSVLRLRGVECNAPERYAEAFYCRKMVFQPIQVPPCAHETVLNPHVITAS